MRGGARSARRAVTALPQSGARRIGHNEIEFARIMLFGYQEILDASMFGVHLNARALGVKLQIANGSGIRLDCRYFAEAFGERYREQPRP